MTTIDLNADLGEGFGAWSAEDPAVLDLVTSANIACGFHAGDPRVMRDTVRRAAERGVAIGAHPGYPDLRGFGRRELGASPEEIEADVIYQLGALLACCTAEGTRVRYLKPHGALYNRAVRDAGAADAIARAIRAVDPALVVLGLPASALARAAESHGLALAREAFLDRGYLGDGTLVPRGQPGALIESPDEVAERAVRLVREGTLVTAGGTAVSVACDSLCVHGDGPRAVTFLAAARRALTSAGVTLRPFAA